MGVKVLEPLASTVTGKTLSSLEFTTRSVTFPRCVDPPRSSACPHVFAPHIVGSGVAFQDAYDASHGVIVVKANAGSSTDSADLVQRETAELTNQCNGARSISICVISTRGTSEMCTAVLDMLSAMALQGVVRVVRLSFVHGPDAWRLVEAKDIASAMDGVDRGHDVYLSTAVFCGERVRRVVTPLCVLISERDADAMDRFKLNVVESVLRVCEDVHVPPILARIRTSVTLRGAYTSLVCKNRNHLEQILATPTPVHETVWTAHTSLVETGIHVRLTAGRFNVSEQFKDSDRCDMNSEAACTGHLVCSRSHMFEVVRVVNSIRSQFRALQEQGGSAIELPLAAVHAVSEKLADTACVCVMYAEAEMADLTHFFSQFSSAGPVLQKCQCVKTKVSPLYTVGERRGVFVVDMDEAFPVNITQRRVLSTFVANAMCQLESPDTRKMSKEAISCKKSESTCTLSTVDTDGDADEERGGLTAGEGAHEVGKQEVPTNTCEAVDIRTMRNLVVLSRKVSRRIQTTLTDVCWRVDRFLSSHSIRNDECVDSSSKRRKVSSEQSKCVVAACVGSAHTMYVVVGNETQSPAVFMVGEGAEGVRVQAATIVNNAYPVLWVRETQWEGETFVCLMTVS